MKIRLVALVLAVMLALPAALMAEVSSCDLAVDVGQAMVNRLNHSG